MAKISSYNTQFYNGSGSSTPDFSTVPNVDVMGLGSDWSLSNWNSNQPIYDSSYYPSNWKNYSYITSNFDSWSVFFWGTYNVSLSEYSDLVLLGSGSDQVVVKNDVWTPWGGDDIISGGSGNDTLRFLNGGSFSDYIFQRGSDSFDDYVKITFKSHAGSITAYSFENFIIGGQNLSYLDTIPTITSFSPSDGNLNVSLSSNITFTFNETVIAGTGSIYLRQDSASGTIVEQFNVATSNRLSFANNILTIDPTSNLNYSTHYYVTMGSGVVTDIVGGLSAGTSSYDFTTVGDTTPPTVNSFNPSDEATLVALSSSIVVNFSEAIQRGTGNIVLKKSNGTIVETYSVATDSHLSISGSSLTINPASDLLADTGYKIEFDSGTIKDFSGNDYAGTTSYNFTTVDSIPPSSSSFSPSDGNLNVSLSSNITFTFNETVIAGTGSIYLRQDSASGTIVEQFNVATSNRLSFANNILTIDPTSNLNYSTHYYVTMGSGVVTDTSGNSFLGTSSYDFTTMDVPDTTPPTVNSFNPSDEATLVALSSSIVVNFSEAIQRGTGNIVLKKSNGTIVETYSVATDSHLSISGSSLTINPASDLLADTGYKIEFDSGTIKDFSGNDYAGTTSYNFTTVDSIPPSSSSFSPSDGNLNVSLSSNITFTFNETVIAGTGSIYLRQDSASGTMVEQFNVATSNRLSFANNILTIDPTSNLNYSTHYYVTMGSGVVTDTSGNSFLGTSSYDFTTVRDTTPPTVSSFSPNYDNNNVDVNANIVLTFNENIERYNGDVLGGNIYLLKMSNSSFHEIYYISTNNTNLTFSGNTLTINPSSSLAPNTEYSVNFDSYSIQDLAGNRWPGVRDYRFTTTSVGTAPVGVTLTGDASNNRLASTPGNDTLDGGLGTDTALFSINKSAVTDIRNLKSGGAVITSSEGTDTLINIENLSFLDGTFSVRDLIASRPLPNFASIGSNGASSSITPTLYTGPVAFLEYELLGNASGDVIVGSSGNDFMNLLGGDDAANGGLGDDVLDGGTGSNFLTGGGSTDTLFLDGRGGTTTWSTVTDFSAGDQVNIWGWNAGVSRLILTDANGGAAGYNGATFHYDLDNNGLIDTSITFTGLSLASIPTGAAMSVVGNGYLLIG